MSVPERLLPDLRAVEQPRSERVYVQIAPLPHKNSGLQVSLSLALDRRYEAEARAIELFSPSEGRLDLEYHVDIELAHLRKELSEAVVRLFERESPGAKRLCNDPPELVPDEVLRDLAAPVARIGRSVFRRLFSDVREFDTHPRDDAPALRAAIRSVFGRYNIIVIKSPVHLFPWALLYDDQAFDPNNLITFNPKRFWGFKHQIEEELDGLAQRVPIQRPARIAVAVCPRTDRNDEHARGPFGALAAQRNFTIEWVRSVAELRQKLTSFDCDCLYFYGHASQSSRPTQTTSCLMLDGLSLSADEIAQDGLQFNKYPVVVFLNGCETMPLEDWNRASIAGLLWHEGHKRVCCITTFAQVPIAFGRAFGLTFWRSFLSGETIGKALLDTRIELLEKYANPLGLLYTIFGKIDTHFI